MYVLNLTPENDAIRRSYQRRFYICYVISQLNWFSSGLLYVKCFCHLVDCNWYEICITAAPTLEQYFSHINNFRRVILFVTPTLCFFLEMMYVNSIFVQDFVGTFVWKGLYFWIIRYFFRLIIQLVAGSVLMCILSV